MNEYNVSAGDKKAKKAQKIARCRGLKNFGWWLFGFLSSFLLVGGAAAIALCVIPAGTYFGEDKDKYLGEDAGKQSLLNLMLNYEKYGIEDFPIITDAITGAIENSPLGDYVTIDMDALAKEALVEERKVNSAIRNLTNPKDEEPSPVDTVEVSSEQVAEEGLSVSSRMPGDAE